MLYEIRANVVHQASGAFSAALYSSLFFIRQETGFQCKRHTYNIRCISGHEGLHFSAFISQCDTVVCSHTPTPTLMFVHTIYIHTAGGVFLMYMLIANEGKRDGCQLHVWKVMLIWSGSSTMG